MSGHTCGIACWTAQEDVCRCSCGGINHGIARTDASKSPVRSRKIQGAFYEFHSVYRGYADICRLRYDGTFPKDGMTLVANERQIEAWPELAAYRGISIIDRIIKPVVCIWVRSDKYK